MKIKKSSEYRKERKEHPSLSKKTISQIVADHEYKRKLKRCEKEVSVQKGYNPYAVCRASVKPKKLYKTHFNLKKDEARIISIKMRKRGINTFVEKEGETYSIYADRADDRK